MSQRDAPDRCGSLGYSNATGDRWEPPRFNRIEDVSRMKDAAGEWMMALQRFWHADAGFYLV